MIMRVHAV